MTDPVKEQMSACLDGELPEAELDLLLKQVSRDPALGATLGRFALIAEALRGQGVQAAPTDFASRISAAIAAEPALEVDRTHPRTRRSAAWLRPVAGLAVAASAAAAAILILQPAPQAPDARYMTQAAAPTAAAASESALPDSASYIVPTSTASNGYVPAARLTNYVVAHSEYSTPLGRRSVLSSVLAEEETEPEPIEYTDSQSTDAAPRQ